MNVMPPLKITNVSGRILSDPEVKADIVNGDGAETGQIITTTVPGYYGQSKQATCLEMGKSVVIKKVLQDRRYKNRELQIMWLLDHPNVVQLEHCFFLSNNMDKLYLNLVIEYLSETVYKVSKPYIKMHVPIPTIYVQLYTNQVNLGDTPSKDIQFRECKDVVTWRTKCIVYLLTVLSGPRANMWGYRIYNCDRYVIHGLYLD